MIIVRVQISLAEIESIARNQFGDMVKAVIDVERGIMAIGGELHSDEEAELLGDGSAQEYRWGVNRYPGISSEDWVEFDSMINIRPGQGNRSRGVDDPETRKAIMTVVHRLVVK